MPVNSREKARNAGRRPKEGRECREIPRLPKESREEAGRRLGMPGEGRSIKEKAGIYRREI